MKLSNAHSLAKTMLRREPSEAFYIMKLHGIEDTDTAGAILSADAPYDVIAESSLDLVLADMSCEQVSCRTVAVIE